METADFPHPQELEPEKLYQVPLQLLHPDPQQPRKYFCENALDELKQTIEAHGILQPLLFTCDAQGTLRLISGERRYRAAILAGLVSVPAIFKPQPSRELALIENIVRENLSVIEQAEAIQQLIDEKICRQKDLPSKLGKAKSTISEMLSLNRLPQDIRDECRTNPLVSRSILVEVAKKRTPATMRALYEKYKQRGLTRGELRKVSRPARQQRQPAAELQQSRLRLQHMIERLYELGFTDETERAQVEEQLQELKKYLESRLKRNRRELAGEKAQQLLFQ